MGPSVVRLILSVFIGVSILRGLCDEERFDLKLDERENHVGLETHGNYTAAVQFHQVLDSGTGLRETNYTAVFEMVARCKVKESRRTFLAMQVNVERLLQKDGTNSELLLPENTVVEAKNIAGEKFLSIAGGPVTGKPRHALLTLLPLSLHGSCTEAETLGVIGPKRVGDSWNANSECFLKGRGISMMGLTNVNATAKLESLENVNSVPCFRLGLSIDFRTEAPPPGIGGLRGQVVSSGMTAQIGGARLLPVDSSLPDMGEDFTGDMNWEIKLVREGRPMSMRTHLKEDKHWKKQLIK
jgi:hypothetical protein